MADIFILRSPSLLRNEGQTSLASAFKYSHHREGVKAIVDSLRELRYILYIFR